MTSLTLINVALFVQASLRHGHQGALIAIARGCGAVLNVDCAICLLPICRFTISWLRNSSLANRILPLDHVLYIHKVIGLIIALMSALHAIMHLIKIG